PGLELALVGRAHGARRRAGGGARGARRLHRGGRQFAVGGGRGAVAFRRVDLPRGKLSAAPRRGNLRPCTPTNPPEFRAASGTTSSSRAPGSTPRRSRGR